MRFIACMVVALAVSGCALTEDQIEVPYQGAANLSVVDGARDAKVVVAAVDKRTVYKDRVGVKKNGYGMEMAKIVATNDVAETTGRAIEKELQSLGFQVGPGGSTVNVELLRFYNDFKTGFFAGDAVADMELNVKVIGPDKNLVFSKTYEGGGIEENIMLAGGDNARAALIKAMRNTVFNVINDAELQQAIMKAQRTGTAQVPTS